LSLSWGPEQSGPLFSKGLSVPSPDSDLLPPTDAVEARVRDYFARLYRPGAAQFHGIVHVAVNPVSDPDSTPFRPALPTGKR